MPNEHLGAIILNPRDERSLNWLRQELGDEAVITAIKHLAGGRKPYVSNIAKLLGKTLPDNLAVADQATAQRHIAAIREKLGLRRT